MLRFSRILGALVVTTMLSAGLAVGLSMPAQARAVDVCASTGGLLSGSGEVGSPLDVALPAWNLTLLGSSVDWLRSGTPIRSGSSPYTPTAVDVGQAIQVRQATSLQLPVVGTIECSWVSNAIIVAAGDPGDPGVPGAVLSALIDPILTGNPAVGSLLTVTAPLWSLPGVSTTYQWLLDGVPIAGADDQFYVPDVADAGRAISAQVTGALAGIPAVTIITDALDIPTASGGTTVSPASDVSINGTRKIGTTLTLSGPTWDPSDATSTYQWLRDEAPVAGATAATYALVPADLGHSIAVKMTGHKDGFTDNTITSDAVEPVVGDAIQFATKPRITGTRKVGGLLTADPGQWTGGTEGSGQPVYSYQWGRDGVAISGAVAQTYQVIRADAGRAITVLVTATRPAYRAGKFTTAAVTVARLASRLSAALPTRTVKTGRAALVKLVLKVPGVNSPTGRVKLFDRTSLVRKSAFAKGRNGRLTVRLTGLEPGVHRLKAVYAGSSTVAGATSKVVKLTVVKRRT